MASSLFVLQGNIEEFSFFFFTHPILACENIHFSSLFATWDMSCRGTSATQWQKFHTDDVNLSGIWSEELIVRRSSYFVLAIVYEWQTKDKRLQRSKFNVNAKNL